jgi:bifunctional UDP-N-acetylglucosamine pyrophosphorylase/glucosamine-1-phosphate N-acetyltransferase
MPNAVVILAAGQGTRMKSDLPKALHPLGSAPLIAHAMQAARALDAARTVLVIGHGGGAVADAARDLDPDVVVAEQPERLGTAHAVQRARAALEGFDGNVVVLYADTPLVRPETLDAMLAARAEGAAVVVLGFEAADPTGYGRLVIGPGGSVEAVVEEREATPAQRQIALCNSGVIAADCAALFTLIDKVRNDNAKGEYYLTDVVGLARADGLPTRAITCPESETLGVNSRVDLAAAEAAFQARARSAALENGVTLTDPASVWFALDTVVGRDVTIGPNVVFGPGVTVESGAAILGFCHFEGCHISRGAIVGPFARLRTGAELAENTKIGNFVEVKNAVIDPGAKVNHLSYVGDAHLGAGCNIGAGTITCNYDGVLKHRTEIGPRAFIGSNTALVAPVTVGAETVIGAGSVITDDVPDGALALARASQANRPGLGRRLMAALRARKADLVSH